MPSAPSLFPRITTSPLQMGGKPCIRGMRVTVGMIVGLLGVRSVSDILAAYPYLEREDLEQAAAYAEQAARLA